MTERDTSRSDEPSMWYLGKVIGAAYAVAISIGWIAGEALKAIGYTHRIEAKIVGGGSSTIVHPVSGEWYAGMMSIPVLLLVVVYGFYIHPRWYHDQA